MTTLASRWSRQINGSGTRATLAAAAVAAASGCAWVLATATFDLWPLAWVAIAPLLWLIERAGSPRRARRLAWLSGLFCNLGGFYWIAGLLTRFGHLPAVAAIAGLLLLCAYQAVVFWLFALLVARLRRPGGDGSRALLPMALAAPLAMCTAEAVVPFLFPWYLAITQAWVAPVIQVAEITGPLGVTALLMVSGGALYDLMTEPSRRRRLVILGASTAAVASAVAFGLVRIAQVQTRRSEAPRLAVGLVQGNLPLEPIGPGGNRTASDQLSELQQASAALETDGAELVVWPETGYPYGIVRRELPAEADPIIRHRRDPLTGAIEPEPLFRAPLILGAITFEPDRGLRQRDQPPYNSALWALDQRIEARFDKNYLLLFGEYIPFLSTFPWLREVFPSSSGHFARGKEVVVFELPHRGRVYRIAPMICYEDILPHFGRRLARHHPHLLVNITNDAWFGDTSEPWQHLALAVFRAVEMRTDLVRAVNTGVSAFVDATGRVYGKSEVIDPHREPANAESLLEQVSLMEGGHTFFARFGDLFAVLCVAATALMSLVPWRRPRRRDSAPAGNARSKAATRPR